MAQSLISGGVSVTITDESFYIPAASPTVPLIFLATRGNKLQPDAVSVAAGTVESGVVRTVTSIGQSLKLFGVPHFWSDASGNQFHGDARNEYGLMALNQFLGVGNVAYTVRANIDLADEASTFIGIGTPVASTVTAVGVGNGTISAITATSAFVKPETIDVIFTSDESFTVQGSSSGIIGIGTVGVAFTSSKVNFTVTAGSTAFAPGDYFEFDLEYTFSNFIGVGDGTMTNIVPGTSAVAEVITVTFTSATAYTVSGSVSGPLGVGTVGIAFDDPANHISFLIEAGATPFGAADVFTLTLSEVHVFNPLGADDAAKRVAITTALSAAINSNVDVRSEIYEYNLILCPGYPELVDELLALSVDIRDEAFVIADSPVNKSAEATAAWAMTSARKNSTSVAYYYPWGLASNIDGTNVVCAASGIALRTYAYSDNMSYVWFAPAGATRGVVTGVDSIGYVTGKLGEPTTFVELYLNQGQRDVLYESFKNINPITYFPGQGILVWGQKSSATAASALDRVNVVRLVMYIKRALRKGAFPFVFEPNDKITRGNLKSMADSFLNGVMAKRGLEDFATICSELNNGPEVRANNEMVLDVAIIPTLTAEFIYIPIRVLAQGADL
jgi:hypothetical protein